MQPTSEPIETMEVWAFVQAAEAKSLSRAAAVLGVPRATLGRRLARLEERLGTRLLRLTTRSLLRPPDVRLQVDASSRLGDLLREGYDVALRASSEIEPGLTARTFGRHKAFLVAVSCAFSSI